MFRRLYDWVMSLAGRKSAEAWLAVIAFVESSVFLIPADALFLPMALRNPAKAYRYALIATTASVLGGLAGWGIGYYAYETIARPVLEFYGKHGAFDEILSYVDDSSILLLMVTSGFAHLPPIKIVTLLAGAVHMNLTLFLASAAFARGLRFFLLAGLIARFGEPIRQFIEQRLSQLILLFALLLCGLYFGYRLFGAA